MGDRLTLETADGALVVLFVHEDCEHRRDMRVVVTANEAVTVEEHKGRDALGVDTWVRVDIDDHDGMPMDWVTAVASALAWAYRERPPEVRDDAPIGCELCGSFLTPGQALDGWSSHPDCEREAQDAALEAACYEPATERGPTEGASDAGDDTPRYSEALRMVAGASVWNEDRWHTPGGFTKPAAIPGMLRDFFEDLDARGRPPTGEASPDIADEAGVWEKRSRAYRKCADRFQAERNEVEDRLGALIGAVEREPHILLNGRWPSERGRVNMASRLRAAVAAAKGDAPTATPSPATRLSFGNDYTTDPPTVKAVEVPAPAPQVPDSPGWWWWELHQVVPPDMPRKPVYVFEHEDKLWVRLYEHGPMRWVVELDLWGGRCTRDAPDAGLRARVEALREALLSYEADPGKGGPRLALAVGDALGDA